MMNNIDAKDRLIKSRVHAVPMLLGRDDRMSVIDALIEGGIQVIELLLPEGRGLDFFEEAVREFGSDVCIGAGSIVQLDFAQEVIDAGAQLIVTPTVAESVIEITKKAGLVCICGAQTPTEMVAARKAGADFVKLFPANAVSPAVLATILVPLPEMPVIAVGAITPRTAPAYISAGALAVASGRYLVGSGSGAYSRDDITERANKLILSVQNKADNELLTGNMEKE